MLLSQAMQARRRNKVHALLSDARRFLLRNRHVIHLAPLQVYSSALIFARQESKIKKQFQHVISGPTKLITQVPMKWSLEILKLEGHDDWVSAVAFSPDGQKVASKLHDRTVRLSEDGRAYQNRKEWAQ